MAAPKHLPESAWRTRTRPVGLEQEAQWLEHTVGVRVLDERAVIAVRGDDAREWLQGQLTNQLEEAKAGECIYGFVLTLKGRVLADVWVLVSEAEIWLDVPRLQVDALLERLDRYIIMEDVDLIPRPDLRVIAAVGPRAGELAEGGWPSRRLGLPGRQWVVPDAELDTELDRLRARSRALGGAPLDDATWAEAHIVRGRPRFGVDFGKWTYPQESGLTPVAVSFTKGCYIGQETVVMLENRGKAPKVLWRWQLEGPAPPPAGTAIERAGIAVGEVTSAVEVDDTIHALGFLKRGQDGEMTGFTIGGAEARPVGPVEEGPGVAGNDT